MQDEKSGITGGWHDRIQNIRYHNSQAISMKKSCLKINVENEVGRKPDISESVFTGSLAEVYQKALTNVLNIQPHIKMEDNDDREKEITLVDKKLTTGALDSRHFVPPAYSISGTYKHSHNEKYLTPPHQNEVNKLKTTNKSAFHVPEKRRYLTNGLSRPTHWSHDAGPLPYPVNYPGDYYQVIHPPAFYTRGSPYHNALIDRMKFYPVPRGGECPPLTHVLPWTPFERDFKPWTSPRYCEWRPKRTLQCEPEMKKTYCDKTLVKPMCDKQHPVVPRPCVREEKTADTEGRKSSKTCESTGGEKSSARVTSHLENNVKTRRMRAFQKKNEFSKENKKETFDSPKEEFLFRLGLTRVH